MKVDEFPLVDVKVQPRWKHMDFLAGYGGRSLSRPRICIKLFESGLPSTLTISEAPIS